MSVCACTSCTTTYDLHDTYVAKQRKVICAAEVSLDEMNEVNTTVKAAKAAYKKMSTHIKMLF